MRDVKVLKVNDALHLVGTLKRDDESIASLNPRIVIRSKRKEEKSTIIKLVSREGSKIIAYGDGGFLGSVTWDTNTNARRLPRFMRRLLNVTP